MPDSTATYKELHQEVSDFLSQGLMLEGEIMKAGLAIREKSKTKYKQQWLDARLLLLSICGNVLTKKNGVPGATSIEISDRLTLLMVFLQGVSVTEILISEGQYIKASAALKQDFELIARIAEVKQNVARAGKVPNVKLAPRGCQQFYGQLNDVAHPSNLFILQTLLGQYHEGDAHGVSNIPTFVEETARALYELHVWLLLQAVREYLLLTMDMYGENDPVLRTATQHFSHAVDILKDAGFVISEQ